MNCQVELTFFAKADTLFIVVIQPRDLTTDIIPGMVLAQKQKGIEAAIDSIEYIDMPTGVLIGLCFKKGNEIAWNRIKGIFQGDQITLG